MILNKCTKDCDHMMFFFQSYSLDRFFWDHFALLAPGGSEN